jgi:hypothetical protein
VSAPDHVCSTCGHRWAKHRPYDGGTLCTVCPQGERCTYFAAHTQPDRTPGHVLALVQGLHWGDLLTSVRESYERDAAAVLADADARRAASIDVAHLARQAAWSAATFGPGPRTAGVLDHITRELDEIRADPLDLGEWVDVVILALDGAWRAGHSPAEIIAAIRAKQARNEARTWPDWRTADPDRAIEHVRAAPTPKETDR